VFFTVTATALKSSSIGACLEHIRGGVNKLFRDERSVRLSVIFSVQNKSKVTLIIPKKNLKYL